MPVACPSAPTVATYILPPGRLSVEPAQIPEVPPEQWPSLTMPQCGQVLTRRSCPSTRTGNDCSHIVQR
jgi:hypothetical protein